MSSTTRDTGVQRTPRAWARGHAITLQLLDGTALERWLSDPAIQRAMADGVDRAPEASIPAWPDGVDAFAILDGAQPAVGPTGVLGVAHDTPVPGAAGIVVLAIAREARGHAAGMRALLVAAARLDRSGAGEVWTCVTRTNGHGLYFMLRAGFAPVPSAAISADAGYANVTWFRRVVRPAWGARRRRAASVTDDSRSSSAEPARGTTVPPALRPPARTRDRAIAR